MPNTVNDFWRMIWEKRISTIVMLTKCIEAAKVYIDLTHSANCVPPLDPINAEKM